MGMREGENELVDVAGNLRRRTLGTLCAPSLILAGYLQKVPATVSGGARNC